MTKEKKIFQPLTSENICEIYNLLLSENLVVFPIGQSSINKIEAIVANVNGVNYGEENYSKSTDKVVAYLYFLIKNHPFVDGNKRTAVLTFLVLCKMNNLQCHLDGFELDELAVFLESLDSSDYKNTIKVVSNAIFSN